MGKSKLIPAREQIGAEYKWNTEAVYGSVEEWEADFSRLKELIPEARQYAGKLAQGAETFLACLRFQEELGRLTDKVYLYAAMKKDEDNNESLYQSLKERIHALAVEAGAAFSFFVPEVLALPGELLDGYLQDERLALYRKHIADIRRFRAHTLSASEEQIVALAGEMAAAPKNIFSMLNNADMAFPQVANGEGEQEQLSHGNYIRLMESQKREVRRGAFAALYATYGENKNTLAAALAAAVKKDVFFAKVRKYESCLEAALFDDNISTAVYDGLIEAVRASLPLFSRYLRMRKDALALDKLHMYDVYAPLVFGEKKKFPYEEAVETVCRALAPLGEEYLAAAREGLKNGWVDVYENKGKTPGAYSSGIYDSAPYILMNYQDNLNSVFTLAHELGHSMHSYYSWKTQPYIYADYKIFVAEVASTVNEILLADHLLRHSQSLGEKLDVINRYLEEFRGTVFRQTMFAEFERDIHQAVEQGGALTAEDLSRIYYKLNEDYFGADVCLDREIALEWARIPHFYNAFYVYKYATGFSAAQALAGELLKEGEEGRLARERYLRFLSGGGSEDPLVLLRQAGVDMESPQPVLQAMKQFEKMLDEFETSSVIL
ncbi:MAG: oligoendopeptidase F [Clostridiales bacterium]|nr:oligoendopeptidase F [Clostridiales bacterium]